MKFNEQGQELPDPTPLEIPAGMQRPESLTEQIRRMVRTELSGRAVEGGFESFEEANDFRIPDEDPDMVETKYETVGMRSEVPLERAKRDVSREPARGGGDVERSGVERSADREPGGEVQSGRSDSPGKGDAGRKGLRQPGGKGAKPAAGPKQRDIEDPA